MRKICFVLLGVAMVLLLSACASGEPSNVELMITRAAEEDVQMQESTGATETIMESENLINSYIFVIDGVELVPGAEFISSLLPEASSVYKVPSCAIDGTDNVYNYEYFELTAFQEGNSEVIYSILLLDPNITTAEGLALGDTAARVTELYGDSYTQEGTARVYSGHGNALFVILQGEYVVSIEYRMITDARK